MENCGTGGALSEPVRFGLLELDLHAGALRRKGIKVRLERQPVQILVLQPERRGELPTQEEIRTELRPAVTCWKPVAGALLARCQGYSE